MAFNRLPFQSTIVFFILIPIGHRSQNFSAKPNEIEISVPTVPLSIQDGLVYKTIADEMQEHVNLHQFALLVSNSHFTI